MNIRRLEKGEETLWLAAVETLISEEVRDGELASIADLTSAVDDAGCYLYLALLDSKPVGLLSAYRFPDVEAGGYLEYLYDNEVDRKHQNNGIGTLLVNQSIEDRREDDVGLIWAGTEANNIPACRIFETIGAELEGESYVEYEWDLGE